MDDAPYGTASTPLLIPMTKDSHVRASSIARRLVLFAAGSLCMSLAGALGWPDKPIKLVVPVAPGGPSDTVARVIAHKLEAVLAQPVIVDNKPGGGANIGTEFVARAAADGYTMLLGTTTQAINASLYRELRYDFVRDFVPVQRLTMGPLVLVVNPALPVKSVSELVALSRKRPLSFASSNVGASTHLAGEMLKSRENMDAVHVPYKGSGPALTDTMGGQVDFMFDTALSAMPFVRSGKLKALAVTSEKRMAMAPDLPTMTEAGQPGFVATSWNGIFVRAGTPQPVVDRLAEAAARVLADPEVRSRFAAQGFDTAPLSGAAFESFVKKEIAMWGVVVKTSKASVE